MCVYVCVWCAYTCNVLKGHFIRRRGRQPLGKPLFWNVLYNTVTFFMVKQNIVGLWLLRICVRLQGKWNELDSRISGKSADYPPAWRAPPGARTTADEPPPAGFRLQVWEYSDMFYSILFYQRCVCVCERERVCVCVCVSECVCGDFWECLHRYGDIRITPFGLANFESKGVLGRWDELLPYEQVKKKTF